MECYLAANQVVGAEQHNGAFVCAHAFVCVRVCRPHGGQGRGGSTAISSASAPVVPPRHPHLPVRQMVRKLHDSLLKFAVQTGRADVMLRTHTRAHTHTYMHTAAAAK